jgi:hypothetical protein
MKVRTGFVSNSSTTSFCIYGASVEDISGDIEKLFIKMGLAKEGEEFEDGYCDIYDSKEFTDILEKEDKRLHLEHMDEIDGYWIGINFTDIKDNETGKQFKETVEKAISNIAGKKVKCEAIEEASYG